MGWERPIITDSGGFQVFSMGHGSVADEIKRRRASARVEVISIAEDGVRFRSYLDGSERFMGPETSMEVQAALGSDIALAFDECTPFHVDRDYTARARCSAPTAGSTAASPGAREHAPAGQLLFGIVQGGVYEDLRAESSAYVAAAGVDGHRDRRLARPGQGADARGGRLVARGLPDEPPRHLLGIGDVDDILHAVGGRHRHLRLRHADAPRPATAPRWCPTPRAAGGSTWPRARHRESREPIAEGCPCPACREHTRGYLHYLTRVKS